MLRLYADRILLAVVLVLLVVVLIRWRMNQTEARATQNIETANADHVNGSDCETR